MYEQLELFPKPEISVHAMLVLLHGLDAKFARKLQKCGECLLWTGSKNNQHYGQVRRKSPTRKMWLAHRYAWTLVFGTIPKGLLVLHNHTGNRNCVNPTHLHLGTQVDNVRDMLAAGTHWPATKTHCKRGHEYTKENTRMWKGSRVCRTCAKQWSLKGQLTASLLNSQDVVDQGPSSGHPM